MVFKPQKFIFNTSLGIYPCILYCYISVLILAIKLHIIKWVIRCSSLLPLPRGLPMAYICLKIFPPQVFEEWISRQESEMGFDLSDIFMQPALHTYFYHASFSLWNGCPNIKNLRLITTRLPELLLEVKNGWTHLWSCVPIINEFDTDFG